MSSSRQPSCRSSSSRSAARLRATSHAPGASRAGRTHSGSMSRSRASSSTLCSTTSIVRSKPMSAERTSTEGSPAGRRRTPRPLAVVAILFVVVPFLTWYWTWFGRSLSDEEIEKYLGEGKPRHAQHALSQIAERIEKGDADAARWNAKVTGLASNPSPDVRMTAAWVMGVEHKSEEFRESLARLLEDPEPVLRRNAALAAGGLA